MSIRCDPCAPKDVPKHIKDALPRDPKIAQLKTEKSALPAEIKCEYRFQYKAKRTSKWKEHQELGQKISRATKKWEEGIKKAYRRQYFYHIHNEELQRQLNNVETAEYVAPVIQHQLAASWESFGVGDPCESKEAVLQQLSPEPAPVPLTCGKTQCAFFCTGTATKKTFCRPAKMMDHVEAHLHPDSHNISL
jgi:hypothetical protein